MAKKNCQSVAERINALINRLADKPAPSFGDLKGELNEILVLAKLLENSTAIRDAEAKIVVLESALEKSDAALEKSNAENVEFKKELEAFREEQKKRDKENSDLPDQQWELLRILEPKDVEKMTFPEILAVTSLPADEVALHLGQLKHFGLADFLYNASDQEMWFRTREGNMRVIARRKVNITERLPEMVERVLSILNDGGSQWVEAAKIAFLLDIDENMVSGHLERLRELGFANRKYTNAGTFFQRHPDGLEYLRAHGLVR
jgi:hypothetical protein